MKNPLPAIKSFLSDNRADIKYILLLLLVSCSYFCKLIFNLDELITSPGVLGHDSINFFYPMYSYAYQVIHDGGMPWWNPLILAGYPLASNPQFALFYPLNIPFLFLDTATAFSISYILHVFLGGVFMYCLCRHLEMQRICAFFAGIVFIFGGFVTSHIYAGHYTLVCAAIWLPLLFLLFDNSLKKQSLPAAIGAGAVLGIQMLAGHIQITYISLIGLAFYFLYFLFTERNGISVSKTVKSTAIPLTMIIIGILLSSVQFLPAYEYSLFSSRTGGMEYAEATTFSLNPGMLSLLFSNPWAGPTALSGDFFVTYFWEYSPYIGIFPLILIISGAYYYRNNYYVRFFCLLSIVAILLAMGSHFPPYWLLYKLAPGFDMFRVPARFIMLFSLSTAVLSGYGLGFLRGKLSKEQTSENNKIILVLAIFTLMIAIVAALPLHKFAVIRTGMIILAILLLISIAFLYLRSKNLISGRIFGISATIFTLANLWFFHMPFIDVKPLHEIYPKEPYIEYIRGNIGNYRVYDPEAVLPKNHSIVYKIPEINGYEATALQSYEGFLGENTGYLGFDANPVSAPAGISNLGSKLNMLSVKYIISSSMLDEDGLRLVFSDSGVNIYENLNVLPVAYMVPCAQTAISSEEIDARLSEPGFEFSQHVLLQKTPSGAKLCNDIGNYECSITVYNPQSISIEIRNSTPGFLFLSEAWYPAWQVHIDGQPGEVLVANGSFMSIFLESGEHVVEFVYNSTFFNAGAGISIVAALALTVLPFVRIFSTRGNKKGMQKNTNPD